MVLQGQQLKAAEPAPAEAGLEQIRSR